MKKKYIRPESRLYAINLSENIASSGVGSGGDIVNGTSIIKFTQSGDGCRGLYSGNPYAPVGQVSGDSYYAYYMDMVRVIQENVINNPSVMDILTSCHIVHQ